MSTVIHTVPLDKLSDHPAAARYLRLDEAAALDDGKNEDGEQARPAMQWARLVASLEQAGRVLSPLQAVRGKAGQWLVADGRSRRAGAVALLAAGHRSFAALPVQEIAESEVEAVLDDSQQRRHLPAYALCYGKCLRHEGSLLAGRAGRPSKKIKELDVPTQVDLARKFNYRQPIISECVSAMRFLEGRPAEEREATERRILAGLLAPNHVKPAAGGRQTAGQPRRESSAENLFQSMGTFSTRARTYSEWTAGDLAHFQECLPRELVKWPLRLRQDFAEVLARLADTPAPAEQARAEKAAAKAAQVATRKAEKKLARAAALEAHEFRGGPVMDFRGQRPPGPHPAKKRGGRK